MSQHHFSQSGYNVVVGWYNPLQTFFYQIWKDIENDEDPIYSNGNYPYETKSVAELVVQLNKKGFEIPLHIKNQLIIDESNKTEPTALQKTVIKTLFGQVG